MHRDSIARGLVAATVFVVGGCGLLGGIEGERELRERSDAALGSGGTFEGGGAGTGGEHGSGGTGTGGALSSGGTGTGGEHGSGGTGTDGTFDAGAGTGGVGMDGSADADSSNEGGTGGTPNHAIVRAVSGGGNPFVGNGYACAVLNDGRVKCWGSNVYGELGLGDIKHRGDELGEMGVALPSVNLGTLIPATAIATGGNHTCVLVAGGRMKCWGFNDNAMLGLEDTANRADAPNEMGDLLPFVNLGWTIKAVSCAHAHTCALLSNDQIKCWGGSANGELGGGNKDTRGGRPGEMAALPFVDLGPGYRAQVVVAATGRSCAILDDGKVKCWGGNWVGQLGLGDTQSRGDGPGEMGTALPPVDLGPDRRATDLALGYEHTCALLDNRQVKCWGGNTYGQLGLGDTRPRGSAPGELGAALPPVDLGAGFTVKSVRANFHHTCVLFESGQVKCWGNNDLGQLGLGDRNNRGDQPNEMGDALAPVDVDRENAVIDMTAGFAGMCALLSTGRLRCWGGNNDGQLGIGTRDHRGDGPGEMGRNLPLVDLGP